MSVEQLFRAAQDKEIEKIQRRRWRDKNIALCLETKKEPRVGPNEINLILSQSTIKEKKAEG